MSLHYLVKYSASFLTHSGQWLNVLRHPIRFAAALQPTARASILRNVTSADWSFGHSVQQTAASAYTGESKGPIWPRPPPRIQQCHCSMASLQDSSSSYATETLSVGSKCHQIVWLPGPLPGPRRVAYSAPPDPLTGGEEGASLVHSSMPNFTPTGATWRPCGAKNLKIAL